MIQINDGESRAMKRNSRFVVSWSHRYSLTMQKMQKNGMSESVQVFFSIDLIYNWPFQAGVGTNSNFMWCLNTEYKQNIPFQADARVNSDFKRCFNTKSEAKYIISWCDTTYRITVCTWRNFLYFSSFSFFVGNWLISSLCFIQSSCTVTLEKPCNYPQ